MFLGWQIAVCVSIVVAGLVSLTALRVVAIGWVVWTLIAVLPIYASWVGIFQLANIATTYGVISSRNIRK
jgi:hypothetical protein